MTTQLHFAQLSDLHISSLGDHHDMLSARAGDFLTTAITQLNQIQDLDFVLLTGDLFDTASREEFEQFQEIISALQKSCYIIPGNHDRRDQSSSKGLTRQQFARHFNPQFEERPTSPDKQVGYWSISVAPDIQLIGLDSTRDDDWGGVIDNTQMRWLENELIVNDDKLIIVAVHHPLHPLVPIGHNPDWTKFICDNGPEVLNLLDQHPQAKIVLTGHHHITKVDQVGQRLHLACPAMVIYPCAYRTLRVSLQEDGNWQLEWATHPVTDEQTIAKARQRMLNNWTTVFPPNVAANFVNAALGTAEDRTGRVKLS
jgi:3',5'-cyclic AMP phosphodiesterase CpdA